MTQFPHDSDGPLQVLAKQVLLRAFDDARAVQYAPDSPQVAALVRAEAVCAQLKVMA